MSCDPLLQSGCLVAGKLISLKLAHEMAVVIVVRIVKPKYATVVILLYGMVEINQVIKGKTGLHTKLDTEHNWR